LKNGRKVDEKCGAELDEHAIFCDVCGKSTNALSTGLSAKENFKSVWNEFKELKEKYYSFSIFITLTAFLSIILGIIFRLKLAEAVHLSPYFFTNLMLLFLVPFTLIPFAMKKDFLVNHFTIKSYIENLKYYPHFFLLVLMNILYFALLKILCTGYQLKIIVDPILHLVRFVLVFYWIAIMFPLPLVMFRKKVNPIKSAIMCYKASAETRWQQFFIIIQIVLINIFGFGLFGVGLIISIPLTYILIERYYHQLDEYELFN